MLKFERYLDTNVPEIKPIKIKMRNYKTKITSGPPDKPIREPLVKKAKTIKKLKENNGND